MGVPDFYTVEEAADLLRIGRTAAYQAARQYRMTGGAEGLPVIAIRGSLRVPRRKLEAWAGGPLGDDAAEVIDLASRRADRPAHKPRSKPSSRTGDVDSTDQGSLPFTD